MVQLNESYKSNRVNCRDTQSSFFVIIVVWFSPINRQRVCQIFNFFHAHLVHNRPYQQKKNINVIRYMHLISEKDEQQKKLLT